MHSSIQGILFNAGKKLIAFAEDKPVNNIALEAYNSLSPIDNADNGEYNHALLWALRNRKQKDIKNIALTGPYGSGKSSIIKTFERQHQNEFSFLNISLATFKEESALLDVGKKDNDENDGNIAVPKDTDLLRLIELSILQQIFYHEKDDKIPDSRFKKIKSFKKSHLVFISIGILLLLLCCLNLFANEKFKTLFHLQLSKGWDLIVHFISITLIVVGTYLVLYRSIRLFNSLKISKLKFQDAEIEIDKGISKSILNNHLDEILYFFEVTKYDVVIIEDLDRFQQTEIFTKLRELNLLINNSKKITRTVTFLYAVRDNMFRDKDRTKFFEFIIPVIPIINFSNSNEKLIHLVQTNGYNISEDLIDNLSFFIDDMRLLYNIINEFRIYKEKLDKKLNQDKLLSMIVYKNIHPNDFVDLSNAKGFLFKTLTQKGDIIKKVQEACDTEINELKAQIQTIESQNIKNIKQLRQIYIAEYISNHPNFNTFYFNSTSISITEILEDINFSNLQNSKIQYSYFSYSYGNEYRLNNYGTLQAFSTIEDKVDPTLSYTKRENMANTWVQNQCETLKLAIKNLENKKNNIRHQTLKSVLAEGLIKIEIDDEQQNQLINILLRNGYIEEDYQDYVSLFYEGSITKEDRDFILNVKSQITSDFDYKLFKIDKIVQKLNLSDFSKDYILNYNLLDYLLKSSTETYKLNAWLNELKSLSKKFIGFIDGYIDNGTAHGILIYKLCKLNNQFWAHVDENFSFTKQRKQEYFGLILNDAAIEDIIEMAAKTDLGDYVNESEDFLNIVHHPKQAKRIIEGLSVKFSQLTINNDHSDLTSLIYRGNHYAINIGMLEKILMLNKAYSPSNFMKRNYDHIQQSSLPELINYIEANINKYAKEVFLKLEQNSENSPQALTALLNNEEVEVDLRFQIIRKSTHKISDVKEIESDIITEHLFETSKIDPTWENVIDYFITSDVSINKALIIFLNQESNAVILSTNKINIALTETELESTKKFIVNLIKTENLTNNIYGRLMDSVPYTYNTLAIAGISDTKIDILIHKKILNITANNFQYLKENYPNKLLNFLETKHADVIESLADLPLESQDYLSIFRSTSFATVEKQAIYNSLNIEVIKQSTMLSEAVGNQLIVNTSWIVSNELLMHILTTSLKTSERIHLFNMRFKQFSKAEVTKIILALPEPYSDIAVLGRRPLLPFGQENEFFANNLKTLGYISKIESEKKGIRISTFKKDNN